MTNAGMQDELDLRSLLLSLELQLMDPAFRKDREQVAALLAEDFREFGSSGRFWSREAIIELLATEPAQPAPAVEDFAIQRLAPEIVLVTYLTIRASGPGALRQGVLRSSLWIHRDSGWKVLFHQGTKIPIE